MAEISSLLNCRTGNSVPRVRIPPPPQLKIVREVAQAGSAPGLGPGGRRFESCLPDKEHQEIGALFLFFFVMRINFNYAYIYSMKSRLNLTIDEKILDKVKYYAERHETSVSEMVETYFKSITEEKKEENIITIVDQLKKPDLPEGVDLKKQYYQEQSKKYGF